MACSVFKNGEDDSDPPKQYHSHPLLSAMLCPLRKTYNKNLGLD
ncbi:MAG TPA: hypothetical protein PKV75_07145 [Desulfobacterales bacterium]|nr:hypothetical protein [Desulfobacterales bacterium]